jgi:hypothetical protein
LLREISAATAGDPPQTKAWTRTRITRSRMRPDSSLSESGRTALDDTRPDDTPVHHPCCRSRDVEDKAAKRRVQAGDVAVLGRPFDRYSRLVLGSRSVSCETGPKRGMLCRSAGCVFARPSTTLPIRSRSGNGRLLGVAGGPFEIVQPAQAVLRRSVRVANADRCRRLCSGSGMQPPRGTEKLLAGKVVHLAKSYALFSMYGSSPYALRCEDTMALLLKTLQEDRACRSSAQSRAETPQRTGSPSQRDFDL